MLTHGDSAVARGRGGSCHHAAPVEDELSGEVAAPEARRLSIPAPPERATDGHA